METTFISIHDLSIDARVLYVSSSITDILGYWPEDVVGKSCFEYFHPAEVPFARDVHGRGVELDKAAVLSYCRIKNKDGLWVGCECVFTVVYDVLVASTSIYRRGMRSQKRAVDAPIVRRLFSSKPRDPRYHMLSLLSHKFSQRPARNAHEPRAAMFLNRFTRTLAIMYATNALSTVLGISPDDVKGKSFYECIQENCLADAIRCLESAKANDSIAYMRFWFRDPRPDRRRDESMTDGTSSEEEEEEEGGVYLDGHMDGCTDGEQVDGEHSSHRNSATSSGTGTDLGPDSTEAIFDDPATAASSSSSVPTLPGMGDKRTRARQSERTRTPSEDRRIEVEAVVSCTSDGLVVILRRAQPIESPPNFASPSPVYANGLFASPWAATPVMPPSHYAGAPPPFAAAHVPNLAASQPHYPTFEGVPGVRGPPMEEFMNSIREVAVFAWSLTGINGSLAKFGRGRPTGESQPPGGLPVWDPGFQRGEQDDVYAEGAYGTPLDHSRHNGHSRVRSEPFDRPDDFAHDGRPGGVHYQETDSGATSTPRAMPQDGAGQRWDLDGEPSYAGFGYGSGNGASIHPDPYLQQDPMGGVRHHGPPEYSPGYDSTPSSHAPAGGFDGSPYAPWLSLESNGSSGYDSSQGAGPGRQSRWI